MTTNMKTCVTIKSLISVNGRGVSISINKFFDL